MAESGDGEFLQIRPQFFRIALVHGHQEVKLEGREIIAVFTDGLQILLIELVGTQSHMSPGTPQPKVCGVFVQSGSQHVETRCSDVLPIAVQPIHTVIFRIDAEGAETHLIHEAIPPCPSGPSRGRGGTRSA